MNEHALKIENPCWWRKRPRTEKCLLVIVGILTVLVIIVLLLGFWPGLFNRGCKYSSRDVCFTPGCVTIAAQVLEQVDLDVNPCEDFYKFACGNFIKNTLIPEDKQSVDSFTVVSDKVYEQMDSLLKKPITKNDIRPFVLVKSLYQACMNTTEIEANSVPNLQRIIKMTGGWPVIDGSNWDEGAFNWINTSYMFMRIGFAPDMFLNFQVAANMTNSSRNSLYLDQKSVFLEEIMRHGFNESIFQDYYNYMVKVAVAFGAKEESARKEMTDVANLIIALARITVPKEDRRNPSLENNPMTIKVMQNKFNYVPWLDYINTMLHPYKIVTYDDIVIVKVPSYYQRLENILINTANRTLANYMYWYVIENYIDYLNEDLRNITLEFSKVVHGVTKRLPKWKECTEQGIRLYVAGGALYVRNFFNKEAKKAFLEMIDYIEHELVKTIKTVDWMDNVTRQNALDKINAMYRHIAYPDELLDDQKLENYYRNLTFNNSDYLGSMLNLSLFKNHVEFPTLDHAWDKRDWRNHAYAPLVAAFYNREENSIEFVAGLLQDVFFNISRPKYMNYGSIGHVIGHEMTHGFDDKGRQFDKDGNLMDWWQPQTKEGFIAKAQCIIDQYSNISVPEVTENLRGKHTQGENIADNAGIKLAYLAYKDWSQKNGLEQSLPGLPYTPEQMFWISVASIWCSVERNESLKTSIMNNEHVPNRYRVNVPLMNSEYFAEDFNCALGSKMNPKHKCSVW